MTAGDKEGSKEEENGAQESEPTKEEAHLASDPELRKNHLNQLFPYEEGVIQPPGKDQRVLSRQQRRAGNQ